MGDDKLKPQRGGERHPMWKQSMTPEEKVKVRKAFEQEMFCFWQQRCHENPEDEEAVAELYALEKCTDK